MMRQPVHPLDIQTLEARFGKKYKWMVISIVAIGIVAAILLSTSFNVAIPVLMRHFSVNQNEVQFVVTAFIVANTIAMLPSPWLVERFGLRRCFVVAMTVLAISTVLGALSQNFIVLIVARVIQGAVSGVLFPLGTIVAMTQFPPNEQGRASGFMGFGMILVPAVAPAIGGTMIDTFGWQAVFLMSLPFCAVAIIGATAYLARPSFGKLHNFDWSGMALLSLMTLAILGCAISLKDIFKAPLFPTISALVTFASLAFFLTHARRQHAIVTREVLQWRPVSLGSIVSFAYGFGLYGSSYQIPVFLQTVRGLSASESGGILLPAGLALAATLPLAGMLADRIQPHKIVVSGLALYGMSSALLWQSADTISYSALISITILGRVGIGLLMSALNKAAMNGLEGRAVRQAAMVINYIRMLGGFLGVALLVVFVDWRSANLGATRASVVQAYCESFLLSALVYGIAMAAAWRMKPSLTDTKHK